jgi:Fur family ferric uptake transcriptional regulator
MEVKHQCQYHKVDSSNEKRQKFLFELAQEKIANVGLKLTNPRREILQVFSSSSVPLTVAEVYKLANKKNQIDRVSVYRIIELFKSLKIIHAIGESGFVFCSHSDELVDAHVYLVCEECRCVEEILDEQKVAIQIENLISKKSSFRASGLIQILGLCSYCS